MKQIIWLLTLVLFACSVTALPLCEDSPSIKTNCSMLTPSIVCAEYNYSIFNMSGQRLEVGNMTLLNDSVYQFDFTLGEGEYVVKICDGAVREVVVEDGGTNMIIAIIILLPMLLGLFMVFGAWSLDQETHAPLRIFLFLMSTVTFWTSMHFGLLSLIEFFEFEALEDMVATTIFWSGWVFGAILAYFMIYLIYLIFRGLSDENADSEVKY